MKLETTTAALRVSLEACAKVTPRKASTSILESIRIVTDGDSRIEGTDLQCYISAILPASTVKDGAAIVGLYDLLNFIKAAEGERITLGHSVNEGLRVETEIGESLELVAGELDEWPEFPEHTTDERSATMDAVELSRAITRTMPAMATSIGRYAMHAAQVQFPEQNSVRFIATDGRRLHMVDVLGDVEMFGVDSIDGKPTLGLLPNEGCKVLLSLLLKKYKRGQEPRCAALSYSLSAGLFRFVLDGVELIVRQTDGDFPRYSAVLLESHLGSMLVDSVELLKRTKLVSAACSYDSPAVLLDRDGDTMRVSAKSTGRKSSAELRGATVQVWPKDSAGFSLNPSYFMDTVKASQADRIEIRWNDHRSPIEFHAEGFRGVVMPINLS